MVHRRSILDREGDQVLIPRLRAYGPVVLLVLFTVAVLAGQQDYVLHTKVLQNNRLLITFELKNYTITEIEKNGEPRSHIEIRGADYTTVPGKPLLPFIVIPLGIPPSGEFRIDQSTFKTKAQRVLRPEPYDPIAVGNDQQLLPENLPPIPGNTYYPERTYEKDDAGFFRDRRIGIIRLYPFRYDPSKKSLLIITRATFLVSFQHSDRTGAIRHLSANDDIHERLFSRLVVNYEQSRQWRQSHRTGRPPLHLQPDTLLKIVTTEEGIHQITYQDLAAAGMNPAAINPRQIHITHAGYEIPIFVKGEEDSVFNIDDYIDFSARRLHGEDTYFNLYTTEQVYWLSSGDSLGKRMVNEDGYPYDTTGALLLHSFRDTLHFEQDNFFVRLSNTSADSTDMWFWDRLYGPDTQQIDLNIPHPDTLTTFDLSVMLHGFTTTAYGHHVEVHLNGSLLADTSWSGQTPFGLQIGSIPGGLLSTVSNTLLIIVSSPVDSVDGIFSNWIELAYDRLLHAASNTITLKMPETIQDTLYEIVLDGFEFADVDIYKRDVSRIINFKKETYQENGSTKYRFTLQDDDITSLMSYGAIPVWDKLKPASIERIGLRNLHDPMNTAPYLIITSPELRTSAEAYALWKQSHGFDCMVVTVSEIYDVFNFGIASPEAVKEFIVYAYENYAVPPSYCLLFGDGTYDYRGINGHQGNHVPVHLSMYWGLWGPVADDGYFARVSGDDYLPDIFIGRFPIRTAAEFDHVFAKIKLYTDYRNLDEWKRDLVFVADSGTAGYNSYPDMEMIIKEFKKPAYDASRCYHPHQMRDDFLREMEEGAVFVNFLSHGGGDVLCGGGFVTSKDIFRMTNPDRMPFWTAFSCVNGFFDEPHPDSQSIGETVLLAPNGGGIGYYGPGSLTYGGNNYALSRRIYEGIFDENLLFFGQFLAYGEIAYYTAYKNRYQLFTYNLLGDPAIALSIPDTTGIAITLTPPSISPGDSMTVQGAISASTGGEAIITCYGLRDSAEIPFSKRSAAVSAGTFSATVAIPDTLLPGKGIVKVYFRQQPHTGIDGIGFAYFSIEQPNISGVSTIPAQPTRDDSVYIKARIFDPDSIIDAVLEWKVKGSSSWSRIPMSPQTADTFLTDSAISPHPPNTTIEFHIFATDSVGNTDTSQVLSYHITGLAELSFASKALRLGGDTAVCIEADIQNPGETIADSFRVGFFTLDSLPATIPLRASSRNPDTIGFDTLSLGIDSFGTARTTFNYPFDQYHVYSVIDPDNWVEEGNEGDNSSIDSVTTLWVDRFVTTPDSGTKGAVLSRDSILYVTIPPNAVNEKTVLIIVPDSLLQPMLQPDITPFPINGDTTKAYGVLLSLDALSDSFTIGFSIPDTIMVFPWLYLWLDEYRKWATVGQTYLDSLLYERNTNHLGQYALFYNRDSVPPTITSRIDNEDYVSGTVYEKKIWVSSVFTDKNGIDVVTRPVTLELNGDTVEPSSYSYPKNPSDIRSLPLKFSKELEDGSYTLIISAYDVNGNFGADTIAFDVSIPFDIGGIGNYPNPVYLDSTIFTYNLSRNADEAQLSIFSSGGRLIREFSALNTAGGYHEIVWNLRDRKNRPVGNGVYFYRFIARRAGEEKIKTFKMAVLR
jgi:hypothetical protein